MYSLLRSIRKLSTKKVRFFYTWGFTANPINLVTSRKVGPYVWKLKDFAYYTKSRVKYHIIPPYILQKDALYYSAFLIIECEIWTEKISRIHLRFSSYQTKRKVIDFQLLISCKGVLSTQINQILHLKTIYKRQNSLLHERGPIV